jgi:hypothetical protein
VKLFIQVGSSCTLQTAHIHTHAVYRRASADGRSRWELNVLEAAQVHFVSFVYARSQRRPNKNCITFCRLMLIRFFIPRADS